jgi:hypothetical protein
MSKIYGLRNVIQQKSGQAFDKHGNFIQLEKTEAHIPYEEFIYRD